MFDRREPILDRRVHSGLDARRAKDRTPGGQQIPRSYLQRLRDQVQVVHPEPLAAPLDVGDGRPREHPARSSRELLLTHPWVLTAASLGNLLADGPVDARNDRFPPHPGPTRYESNLDCQGSAQMCCILSIYDSHSLTQTRTVLRLLAVGSASGLAFRAGEARPERTCPMGNLKPGQPAPRSGQYEIRGPRGGHTGTERTVVRGEPLPPTPGPKQTYTLTDPTKNGAGRK